MVRNCPFCDYEGPSPILWKDRFVYAITPLNPVTEGHTLFIPLAHVPSALASPAAAAIVLEAAANFVSHRWANLDVNFITSCGYAATQTIEHLHIHAIPRKEGDGLALPWTDQELAV